MVRRHDALPRRALRGARRVPARRAAPAGRALLPPGGGTQRARGRGRLSAVAARLSRPPSGVPVFVATTRSGTAETAAPPPPAPPHPTPARRTSPAAGPAPLRSPVVP